MAAPDHCTLDYVLTVTKSEDGEAAHTFTGIASTPELDRAGHTIDPDGVTFSNPVALLFHHNRREPVGTATLTKGLDGVIEFVASIPSVLEPGRLRDRTVEAWQSVKAGIIRGVSIGFAVVGDGVKFLKNGDIKFTAIEIIELSLVTVPANKRASILTIKKQFGQPALRSAPAMDTKTIAEQITAAENTRAAKAARMAELMTKAAGEDHTLDAEQSDEYDKLELEVKALDTHMTRLRSMEQLQIKAATPIAPAAAKSVEAASNLRAGVVSVKPNVPPGTAFVRAACGLLVCKGNFSEAAEYTKRWDDSTPEVSLYLKAAVAAGNTTDATWAGPLVQTGVSTDFLELLRPATILGKIPNLRRVPFNTKVPSQTGGGSYSWVGEAKPKPVTKLQFGAITLGVTKVAGIVVLTEELVRLSTPSAEALVRADMVAGIAQFLDSQFIDPAVAAVAGVNPASITNGAPTAAATTNPLNDIVSLINHFASNNIPVTGVTFIMSPSNALSLSMRTNSDGSPQYPGITMEGGTYKGMTIIASTAALTNVIAVQPSLVLYADDGGVSIDASREASLQMDSAPASPADATTVYVSLWQTNHVGLRAERFINWVKVNANAVKYLTAAAYTPTLAAAAAEPPAA